MTSPKTADDVSGAIKPLRTIFALALLAIVGLGLIIEIVDWLVPNTASTAASVPSPSSSFSARSYASYYNFVAVFETSLVVVAVLLATHIKPMLAQGKLVTIIATVELGLMAFLGLICLIFGTYYRFDELDRQQGSEYQSLTLPKVIIGLFEQLLAMALLGLAIFFVVRTLLALLPARAATAGGQYDWYAQQQAAAGQQAQTYGQQAYAQQGYDQAAYGQAAQQQAQVAAQQQAYGQQQTQGYPQTSYGQQTSGTSYGAQTGQAQQQQQQQQAGSYGSSPYAAYNTPAAPTSGVPGAAQTSSPPAAAPTSAAPTSGSPAIAPTSGAAAAPGWPSTPTGATQTWPPTPTTPASPPTAQTGSPTDDAQRTQLITPEMRQQMARSGGEETPSDGAQGNQGNQQQQPPSWS